MKSAASIKRYGQHYTPTGLARFLAERTVSYIDVSKDRLVILDPACGDGELLIEIVGAIKRRGYRGQLKAVGYEIDREAVKFASDRLQALNIDFNVINDDFLKAQNQIESASVNVIISNPPYVRTQQLGAAASKDLSLEFQLSGRVDLTHPFVKVFHRILVQGGHLGLLCSNRFISTISGRNIRKIFVDKQMNVLEMYDLGDTKLFKAAVLPAIVIANNNSDGRLDTKFVSCYESNKSISDCSTDLYDSLKSEENCDVVINGKSYSVRVGKFILPNDPEVPWRISYSESDSWLEYIERHTWAKFGDVSNIKVGIKTTADKVFISDNWSVEGPEVEDALLFPLITNKNISKWKIESLVKLKVLYPYDTTSDSRSVVDLDDYPGTKRYLLKYREALAGRKYLVNSGRSWFEHWVPHKPAIWRQPKIVFPDISSEPRFAFDDSGAIVNGNCYWIPIQEIQDQDLAYLIIAVANSSIGLKFYDEVCGNKLYSGKRRWMTQYVKKLPLPSPYTSVAQELIATVKAYINQTCEEELDLDWLDDSVYACFEATTQYG